MKAVLTLTAFLLLTGEFSMASEHLIQGREQVLSESVISVGECYRSDSRYSVDYRRLVQYSFDKKVEQTVQSYLVEVTKTCPTFGACTSEEAIVPNSIQTGKKTTVVTVKAPFARSDEAQKNCENKRTAFVGN